jgi:putative hydroxymethylpyrimidine transport system substrate-binding protein
VRLTISGAVALCAALVLVACGQQAADEGGSSGSSPDTKLTHVTMVQEWPVADGFWIPWILGKQKGFYEEAGIDLQIVPPPTVADTMKYLGTGRGDVAFTTIMDVIFAKEQGAPVVGIGKYTNTNNWGIISKTGDKLTAEQLGGKTIGIYNDAWTKAQLGIMLDDAGLKLSDVKTVAAADDTVPLLLRDKVDAITGVTNAEGSEMLTAGKQKGEFLAARDHGVPDSPVWVFAANTKWMDANKELAQKFMDATQKSQNYALDHQAEGVDAYFAVYKKAFDRAFVTQQWKDTAALLEKGEDGSSFRMTDEMWGPLVDVVKRQGIVKKTFPAGEYYTNELVGGSA